MTLSPWQLEPAEIAALVSGTHGDPFARLGIHKVKSGYVARTVIPGAEKVSADVSHVIVHDAARPAVPYSDIDAMMECV